VRYDTHTHTHTYTYIYMCVSLGVKRLNGSLKRKNELLISVVLYYLKINMKTLEKD
jgi:hypothetical protein